MDEEIAKELLLDSYAVSADRVFDALTGSLAINNSREPGSPPGLNGEIVGLCGQGGRHIYFRVSDRALRTAAESIRQLRHSSSSNFSVDRAVEEVATICQNLRRQTSFDDHSGCVNDRLPAIVPLLPPEEVWYDGRQLPLDVWRLISFEIDLVSSSISSHTSVDDIAFGSLSQTGLAFRALMSQIQNRFVQFNVDVRNLGTSFPTRVSSFPYKMQVSLAQLFFSAGCLLTPLHKSDLPASYTALRYLHWISKTGSSLSVLDKFNQDSVDCRYRGLFAEEIAIGLMAIVLADVFGAKPIINTVEYFAAKNIKLKGGSIADFIAKARHSATQAEWTVIAESKGSLGNPVNQKREGHAKKQASKTKLRLGRTGKKLPLAFCSSIFFSGQNRDTSCIVIDPPSEDSEEDAVLDTTEAWRTAFSKAFRFVGLDSAAQQVLRGEPVSSLQPMYEERIRAERDRPGEDRERVARRRHRIIMARQVFNADLILDVGLCAIGMDIRILNFLRKEGLRPEADKEIENLLPQGLAERDRMSFLNYLGLGCIFYEELDRPG